MKRLCPIILVWMVAFFPVTGLAQTSIADAQAVAIAFYKTAGTPPPFEEWIKKGEVYRLTAPVRRPALMEREKARLIGLYRAFEPQKTPLTIRTRARVELTTTPDPADPAQQAYALKWTYAQGQAEFFPYPYHDHVFAVLPVNLELFQTATLDPAQYDYLKEALGRRGQAALYLTLLTREADATQPYRQRGADLWAVSADIAAVSLLDDEGRVLWEKTAPWHVTTETESLNELYKDPVQDRETEPGLTP